MTSPAVQEQRQAILRAAFRADLTYWIEVDPRIALRVISGLGKPEPLHQTRGAWSRRITQEHRMVYEINPTGVFFATARHHYGR